MAWSNEKLEKVKSLADNTSGRVNKASRTLLEIFEPSNTNIFDCILTPENAFSFGAINDIALTKLYLQSITIPQTGFTYEQGLNRFQLPSREITGSELPESLTFKFLDNEQSFVRHWLQSWKDEIYDSEKDVYANDQLKSLKKAIVIPQTKLGTPQTAWIEITGIKLKSISEFTFAHSSAEPLMIDVTVKIDRVRFLTLF